ncbi:MAG: hypothetical protein K6V97_03875 [Actinomycetia bacterium]|nr:hypothetical protein [Actinomycetes bacterium]
MIDVADWVIQQQIAQQLQTVKQQASTLVPSLFAALPATEQNQLVTALAQSIPVNLGYVPTTTVSLPGIWVYGDAGAEQPDQDVIGQQWYQTTSGSPPTATEAFVVFAQSTWRCVVVSINLTLTLALAALVRWALYQARPALSQPPTRFITQVVSWGPLQPVTDAAGDVIFPYSRTVTLTARHPDTWATTGISTVSQATATVQPTA